MLFLQALYINKIAPIDVKNKVSYEHIEHYKQVIQIIQDIFNDSGIDAKNVSMEEEHDEEQENEDERWR